MHIEAHFLGGESIKTACADACALAARIGCDVHFRFNDVLCMAFTTSYPEDLEASWWEVSQTDRPYKIATGPERPKVTFPDQP